MPPDHFNQFLPALCAGCGLVLAGGVNLLLTRRGFAVRAAVVLAAGGLAAAGASALNQPGAVVGTVRLFALALLPCLLLASPRVTDRLANLAGSLQRPSVRFGLLTIAGVGLVIGAIMRFESAEKAIDEATLAELEETQGRPPSAVSDRAKATTDRGTPLALKDPIDGRGAMNRVEAENKILQNMQLDGQVIRRGPADDRTNCHGWVFTGGQFLLGPDEVELILKENGYQEVYDPQPGDVVVYRQGGQISHTALVRYVTEGQPLLVEGKWGTLGVFLHPASKSIYGTDFTIHRTARPNHLVAGVGGPAPSGVAPSGIAVTE